MCVFRKRAIISFSSPRKIRNIRFFFEGESLLGNCLKCFFVFGETGVGRLNLVRKSWQVWYRVLVVSCYGSGAKSNFAQLIRVWSGG